MCVCAIFISVCNLIKLISSSAIIWHEFNGKKGNAALLLLTGN